MRGEIEILNLQHPAFTITDQPQTEGFTQRVPRAQKRGIALAAQQIIQGVPRQFRTVLKGFGQALLLPFIQLRRLKKTIELIQRLADIGKALLPANVCVNWIRLSTSNADQSGFLETWVKETWIWATR